MARKKLRFMWNNLVDQAALTASTADPEFPVTNLANELFLKPWRSTGFADEKAVANLSALASADRQVRAWAIKYHNLDYASGDDYKIQGSDNDLAGAGNPAGGDVNDVFTPTPDITIGFFPTAKDFDYWRLVLKSPGSKAGAEYQRIGRWFLGDYFEPTYDVSRPPDRQIIDDSGILRTRQGQEYVNAVTPYEVFTYVWNALPASDIASLKAIYQAVGESLPYFICEDATNAATAYASSCYVKNIEPWTFSPVVHGWGSLVVRVKTER